MSGRGERLGDGSHLIFMDSTAGQAVEDRSLLNSSEIDDVAQCQLEVLSEKEYAELLAKGGVEVYEHKGRFWRNSNQFGSFLLVPVHWMAELTPEEASFPRPLTLGIKARVSTCSQNNGFFNLYMIDDP